MSHVGATCQASGMCQGASYRVGALASQSRAALHAQAYPAKALWMAGAGWGGSRPNLADSLQLCGTFGEFSLSSHRNPCPMPLPASLTLTMLLSHPGFGTGTSTLGSPATGCLAVPLGRGPTSSSAHGEQSQHLALSAASFLCWLPARTPGRRS